MDFNGWANFEDFIKACGYTNNTNSNNSGSNNNGGNDIPNGFQDLDPGLFVSIGTILGEIVAGNIPFNVQNALGNWFELLGQVILTYNAQQQYFQLGPGLYYDPKNCNIYNHNGNQNHNGNSSNNGNQQNQNLSDKIDELEARINALTAELKDLKRDI